MSRTWSTPPLETLPALLRTQVEANPGKTCLVIDGERITYAQMLARSSSVANGLLELGVKPGDAVGAFMENSPDMLYTWFGCCLIGGVYVPVNTAYRGEFLRHQLGTAQTRVVIVDEALRPRLAPVMPDLPQVEHLVVRPPDGESALDDHAWRELRPGVSKHLMSQLRAHDDEVKSTYVSQGQDPGVVLFTAGTTGVSKGVLMSQNYLVKASRKQYELRGGAAHDVTYGALPLFHLAAMSVVVLAPMTKGGTGALDPRFSVSRFWDRVRDVEATHVIILGSMAVMLWNRPHDPRDADNSVRIAFAVPVPAEIHERFEERFALKIVQIYAQSEAYPITITSHEDPSAPGYSGKPNPLYDVRLFDDMGAEVPVGEVGEVVVRPLQPHIMFEGYYNNPEATLNSTKHLWYHTGDLGRFNKDNLFQFVDRKQDYLRRRGENISSYELERAISLHPKVAEVAIVGVPSEFSEDDVKACIVPADAELTVQDLFDYFLETLPDFAVPRYIEFYGELPKNSVGRVLKYTLREQGVGRAAVDRERLDQYKTRGGKSGAKNPPS